MGGTASGSWPVVVEMLVAVSNTVLSLAHNGGGTSWTVGTAGGETVGTAEEETVGELVAEEGGGGLVVG